MLRLGIKTTNDTCFSSNLMWNAYYLRLKGPLNSRKPESSQSLGFVNNKGASAQTDQRLCYLLFLNVSYLKPKLHIHESGYDSPQFVAMWPTL